MAKAKAKKKKVTKSKPATKKANAKPAKKSVVKTKSAAKKTVKSQKSTTKPSTTKNFSAQPAKKPKLIDVSEFVTPLDDRMIVQVLEGEKVTAGGIIIPDTITGLVGNRKGFVLSVGRGHRDAKGRIRPMDVRQGDQIVFPDFTGSKINYQGEDLIILRETDVMGVLD